MSRSRRKLKTNKQISIYCEGESERQYLTMLKQKYRTANVKIKVIAADLSGKKLIEKAIKSNNYQPSDEVYVVFDRDEHSKDELRLCQQIAKKNRIQIIFSSIDFEIWILMHFEPVFRAYTRNELVTKLSGKEYFNQNYKNFKGNSYRQYLFDKVQTAVNNAKQLYDKHDDLINDDPFINIHLHLKKIFDRDDF